MTFLFSRDHNGQLSIFKIPIFSLINCIEFLAWVRVTTKMFLQFNLLICIVLIPRFYMAQYTNDSWAWLRVKDLLFLFFKTGRNKPLASCQRFICCDEYNSVTELQNELLSQKSLSLSLSTRSSSFCILLFSESENHLHLWSKDDVLLSTLCCEEKWHHTPAFTFSFGISPIPITISRQNIRSESPITNYPIRIYEHNLRSKDDVVKKTCSVLGRSSSQLSHRNR